MCMNIPFKIFFRWGDFIFLMKISFSVHIPFRKILFRGDGRFDPLKRKVVFANVERLGVISPKSSHVSPSKVGPNNRRNWASDLEIPFAERRRSRCSYLFFWCSSNMGLSKNSVPYTQWLMIIIPIKWLQLGIYPIFRQTHISGIDMYITVYRWLIPTIFIGMCNSADIFLYPWSTCCRML